MKCTAEMERIRIPGPRGELAGELAYSASSPSMAVLLVPPHPHMGGSMDNNIIRCLAAELTTLGAITLRFDYAGIAAVAASMARFWETGDAPEDPLMVEDAAAARAWLTRTSDLPQVIIGYSFGAFVAVNLAARAAPRALVLISPTIAQHDFSALRRCAAPALAIYSDDDFATPAVKLDAWVRSMRPHVEPRCITSANHFFIGREREIADACRPFIQTALAAQEAVA